MEGYPCLFILIYPQFLCSVRSAKLLACPYLRCPICTYEPCSIIGHCYDNMDCKGWLHAYLMHSFLKILHLDMCSPYKTNWPALNHLKLLGRSFSMMQTRFSLLAFVVFMVFLDMQLDVRYDRNLFYNIAHAQNAPTNIVLLYNP